MTAQTPALDFQRAGLVFALRELIDALDRRGPQIERAGETRIAQDALVLRREAVERLDELEPGTSGRFDDDRAQAS